MAKIFISYAHRDETWKERVKVHLAALDMDNDLDIWDDSRIAVGQEWEKEIEAALDSAQVALLLITAHFLASRFIKGKEVPRILERRKNEGLRVFSVIVEPCPWQEVDWLNKIQNLPKYGKPLSQMRKPEADENLSRLAKLVRDALTGKNPETPDKGEKKNIFPVKTTQLTQLPPRLGAFIGREDELKSLEAQLEKQAPVLLVQGLGGIGKTELCKHYLWSHDDDYQQVGWLDYSGSLKATFVSQLEVPGLDIPVSGTLDEQFAPIRRYLAGLGPDTLLVIDNIDWPEDPDLPLLGAWRCRVLANSRCRLEGFSLFALEFLSKEACRELFIRHCPAQAGESAAIDRLVERAGRHTLTVELLARTAHAAGLTAPALDKKLAEKGFNLDGVIQENIATLWGNDKNKHKFFEHLGRVFDLSGLSGEEKTVLANISLLPALVVEIAELKDWLGLESADSLNRLVDKGWLKRAGNGLEMHAVIGEVVRYKEKPTAKTCKNLIKALARKLSVKPGENPLAKQGYVVFGRAVVDRLAEADEDLATLANNLSLIYQALGQLDQALAFQLKTIEIYEKVLDKEHPWIATSYNNLSTIYQSLGQLDQALEFQLKTTEIFEKVLGPDHPSLATSYNNLSTIYQSLGQLDQALAFQLKTLEIKEKVLGPDHPSLATSYNNLSGIYQALGQLDRALEYQQKALAIREKVLSADHPDLANSYHNLSTIYRDMKDLDQARDYARRAVAILARLFPNGHPNLDLYRKNLAMIEAGAGQKKK